VLRWDAWAHAAGGALLCLVVVLARCTSDDAPSAEEVQSRLVTTLRGDPGEVLHARLVSISDEPDELEAWVDWEQQRWRVDSLDRRGRQARLILGDTRYAHLPALDHRTGVRPSETDALIVLGVVAPGEVKGDGQVERISVDGTDVWRIELESNVVTEDSPPEGYCLIRRIDVDVETARPLAVSTRVCGDDDSGDSDLVRFELVELIDRNTLPDDVFDPHAVRAELLQAALADLGAGPAPAYWLGAAAGDLRLREVRRWTTSDPRAELHYSARAETREPSAAVLLAPAATPPRLACDPPPSNGAAPPEPPRPANPAAELPGPLLTTVSTMLGPAEYCSAPGTSGELRIVLGETTIVLAGHLPLDELIDLLEQLEPLGPAATIEP